MPKTLVDGTGPTQHAFPEPPQKTVPDLGEEEPASPPPPEEPAKKLRGSWPYILIGSLLFMSVAGPLAFYFVVWRYRPTALMHIPRGTNAAVRFDGRELYLYEPFRTNVIGAFDDAASKGGRADRLKKHTGLDVRKDIREVIFATSFGDTWVVLIGGNFSSRAKTKFTLGLSKFLEEEGVSGFKRRDDGVLAGPLWIAQAEDSSIVIANTEETLDRCMDPNETYQDLGLASSGAMSFVADRPVFETAAGPSSMLKGTPVAAFGSIFDAASQTQKVTGHLALGREVEFLIDATPTKGTTPEELTKQYESVQSQARLASLLFLPEAGGLTETALNARIKPRATSVMVEATWDRKKFDAFLEDVGAQIRAAFE